MKMYVLVRKDFNSIGYSAAQAGHALAQYMLDYPDNGWNNSTLIYLGVDDEEELDGWRKKARNLTSNVSSWHEPDVNDEFTAFAVLDTDKKLQRLFKKLPLL